MQLSFLQSKEWEGFQKSVGRKTWRVENALVILHELPMGFSYLYCPYPDVISSYFAEAVKKEISVNAIFLKIDPLRPVSLAYRAVENSQPLQPHETVILDLRKTEGELLGAMHEKARYNIRLAERHGVTVRSSTEEKDFEIFWALLQETAARDRFHLHAKEYYWKLLQVCSPEFSNELFFAEYGGRAVAALMANFYKPAAVAVYLHGASSRAYQKVMAPQALHWHMIREAKGRGFLFYDLWGIDVKKWPGLTRFKKGFGGNIVEYPETIDVVYRPIWYALYQFFRKIV